MQRTHARVRMQRAFTFTNNAATEGRRRGADNELTKCHAAIPGRRNKQHLQQENECGGGTWLKKKFEVHVGET